MGKLLRVDLTRRRVSEETVSSEMYRRFLGGRGVGVALLYDAVKPRVDPLSEDNVLMFVATPLNGTGAPSFVKYTVETKSPLTGTVLMTLAGGHFAAELRRAGLDAIVVEGRAEA
ncbi:MAG: aldehyde ferredoxin oxidoreductase N-terminal domain-containing protein, partial [Candidatus Bathyarchaeia archaeon]